MNINHENQNFPFHSLSLINIQTVHDGSPLSGMKEYEFSINRADGERVFCAAILCILPMTENHALLMYNNFYTENEDMQIQLSAKRDKNGWDITDPQNILSTTETECIMNYIEAGQLKGGFLNAFYDSFWKPFLA